MKLSRGFLLGAALTGLFGFSGVADSALPFGIFPFLTSAWYYKPSPAESVVLGLIVVKVLALRLASITGILPIPYHLNDLFLKGLGKRSLPDYFTPQNLTFPGSPSSRISRRDNGSHTDASSKISSAELAAMFRVLLGIRRIDTSDCFLKKLCFIGRECGIGDGSQDDRQLLHAIRYLISAEKVARTKTHDNFTTSPVMDVYENALNVGSGKTSPVSNSTCTREYFMCSLTKKQLQFESVISELF